MGMLEAAYEIYWPLLVLLACAILYIPLFILWVILKGCEWAGGQLKIAIDWLQQSVR